MRLLLICLSSLGVGAFVLPSDHLDNEEILPPDVFKHEVNSSYIASRSTEGLLTGVFSAFTVTAVSEIGDKTFFIAVVLSLTHSPIRVFGGALTALALMTILSASLGLVFSFLTSLWVQYLSAVLFLVFGFKMLREGCFMSSSAGKEEFEEVQKTVEKKMIEKGKGNSESDVEAGGGIIAVRWAALEAFTMTFISEWGDRSQIATVILAAKHNVVGVVLGSILGHAACTLMAVVGGRLIADWISVRTVTVFGGVLFLAFALSSLVGALEETTADAVS